MRTKPKLDVVPVGSSNEAAGDASLTDKVCRMLRCDIIDGAFSADQPLRLEFLKERYGISFSPIREALNRLQSEKLVVSTAARGFRVAPLSITEMWDTIDTRILIDCEALRKSIANADNAWEAALVGAFHALKLSKSRPRLEESEGSAIHLLQEEHSRFHAQLIGACGSNWLINLSAQLYMQTERYRRPYFKDLKNSGPHTRRNVEAEHSAILDAAIARDADLACALLARHYRETGLAIVNAIEDSQAKKVAGSIA